MIPSSAQRAQVRWLVAAGLARALATTVVLVGLYFLSPLDAIGRTVDWGVIFTAALVILVAITAFQVRAVLNSPHPAIQGIEGVATTVPPFVLLFAATYFVMSESSPGNFSAALNREDALYFAVTVFASVGFGDITATTTAARMVVTLQMVLNLLVLGAGVRVFVGAVTLGRKRGAGSAPDGDSPP